MTHALLAVLVFGLSLWFSGEVWAGGAGLSARSGQSRLGPPLSRVPTSPLVRSNRLAAAHKIPGHVHAHHYYRPPYYRYYHAPVIIIAPTYHYPFYYSYYSPASVLLSTPFYCFLHHEGFITRIAFLDHVSGTHKVPLETAAAVCPEGRESCVIEGY